MKPARWILALALVACSSRDGNAWPRKEHPHVMRYLALGDSYTIGESVDPASRWPMQLAARLRAEGFALDEPEIIAKTGWTTSELADGIHEARPRGDDALVTLLIGVNNQYRGYAVEDYRAEFVGLLKQAIGFAGGHADRVVVLSIPDWGVTPFAHDRDRPKIAAEIDRFNVINRDESKHAGVRWVDVTPVSREAANDAALVAGDGLHPSPAMYTRWTELALPSARAALQAQAKAAKPKP